MNNTTEGVYTDEKTEDLVGNNTGLEIFEDDPHILDDPFVRVTFILLYTVVFILCFCGNLAVVLVVMLRWKIRSITKFCLGNMAFANLCVGVFCVYQNLSTYLLDSWLFGDFLCKMYHFTNSLCHTASILILVVVSIERYLVVLQPARFRQILTIQKALVITVGVWTLSAGICAPRLYYFGTISIPVSHTTNGLICVPKKSMYNSATADTIYFVLLYILPLTIISVLHTRIALCLRESEKVLLELDQRSTEHPPSSLDSACRHAAGSSQFESHHYDRQQQGPGNSDGNELQGSSIATTSTSRFAFTLLQRSALHSQTDLKLKHERPCKFIWRSSFQRPRAERSPPESIDNNNGTSKRQHVSKTWPAHNAEIQLHPLSDEPSIFASPSNFCRTITRTHYQATCNNHQCHCRCGNYTSSYVPITRQPAVNSAELTQPDSPENQYQLTRLRLSRLRFQRRQSVVRMLLLIAVSFAVFNLPFHVRKLCVNYLPSYDMGSDFNNILAPMTFLFMYANCAINPVLYAVLSKHFRTSLRDLIRCTGCRS